MKLPNSDSKVSSATTLAISCFLIRQSIALQPENRLKAESKLSLLVEARFVREEYSGLQLAWLLVRQPDQGGALVHLSLKLKLHIRVPVNMSRHLKISSNTMSCSMPVIQSLLE